MKTIDPLTLFAMPDRPRRWAEVVLLAVIYFLTAQLGQLFALPPGNVTPVWIPSGIILAAVLIRGYYLWPGIFLGAFAGNAWAYFDVSSVQSSLTSLFAGTMNGAGDALCALVGACLIIRSTGTRYPLNRASNVIRFIAYGAMVGGGISAIFGVTALCAAGFVAWDAYWTLLITWWTGDGVGVVIITPLLLALHHATSRFSLRLEQLSFLLLLVLATAYVLGLPGAVLNVYPPMLYLIPVFLWSIFRMDERLTFITMLGVAATAVVATAMGYGRFSDSHIATELLELQLFFSALALTVLVLHGLVQDRARARTDLQQAHDQLEDKVARRTAQLEEARESLETKVGEIERLNQRLDDRRLNLEVMIQKRTSELVKAKRLAEQAGQRLSEFLDRVAGEKRALAETILTSSGFLADKELDTDLARHVDLIDQSAKKLQSLVEEMIEASESRDASPSP